jgi:hypothetical protein
MKWILPVVVMLAATTVAWGQVPSEGFEQWDSSSAGEVARGWWGGPFGSSKVDDAHSGRYAASVWNWYFYAMGYIITGPTGAWYNDLVRAGVPISYKPTRLTGYYRYVLGKNGGNSDGNDSAVVYVMLKRYNPQTMQPDTIGFVKKLLGPTASYIPFTVDIRDYAPGVDPDSVVICFVSSEKGFCNNESEGTCCYLSIDDIQLSTSSGVAHSAAHLFERASVHPNPMRADARVEWSATPGREYRLIMYDAAGRRARTIEGLTGGSAKLDRSGLSSGEYLFEIRDQGNMVAARGRVMVE